MTSSVKDLKVTEKLSVRSCLQQTTWFGGYGHWLRDKRKTRGISLVKLSKDIGISKGVLQHYEEGTSLPSVKNQIVLTEYFNGAQTDGIRFKEKS